MHENVIATILRGNEAEALFITKPFDFTSTHKLYSEISNNG
jgi:hypothetical protein